MTKSDKAGKDGESGSRPNAGEERRDRAARALRENLKKRKQQLKAREKPSN